MKIESSKLHSFLKKATLAGKISSAIIKVENKQMNIWVRSIDNSIAVNATLNNVNDENSVWAIKDMPLFLGVLELFSGQIELKSETSMLSIFDSKIQVDIKLAEESFIDNNLDKKVELPYDKKVTLPSDVFKNSIKNKRVVKSEETTITILDNKLIVSVGSKHDDVIKESLPIQMANLSVKFGSPLDDVINVLGDKVDVGLKTDFPITFIENTSEFTIIYVVAPRVDVE